MKWDSEQKWLMPLTHTKFPSSVCVCAYLCVHSHACVDLWHDITWEVLAKKLRLAGLHPVTFHCSPRTTISPFKNLSSLIIQLCYFCDPLVGMWPWSSHLHASCYTLYILEPLNSRKKRERKVGRKEGGSVRRREGRREGTMKKPMVVK